MCDNFTLMKKHIIGTIIVAITLALIGLTALQIRWIKHGLHIEQERFERSVNDALKDIANKLEMHDAFSGTVSKVSKINRNSISIVMNDSSVLKKRVTSNTRFEWLSSGDFRIFEKTDSSYTVEVGSPDGGFRTIKELTSPMIHGDSLGTRTKQSEMQVKLDSAGRYQFIDINKDKEAIASEINRYRKIFSKMALQLAFLDKPLKSRIDSQVLHRIVSNVLKDYGIHTSFEYGIRPADTDTLILRSNSCHTEALVLSRYKTDLFTSDLFANKGTLFIYFPDLKSYILGSAWIMFGISVIFVLIIVLGFVYTIGTIFRQKKLSEMKTDFINNMTHELKTPISTISLASEMLRNDAIGANSNARRKYADIIYEENQRLGEHVEKVLQVARLEKGELKIKPTRVDVNRLIETMVKKASLTVEKRQGIIRKNLCPSNPIIRADKDHLANVIANLLDNANKYSVQSPDITIATEVRPEAVVITVADQGIGMNKETQKRIFDKFYRLTNNKIHDVQGFGLGLSYVKLIVEKHGGKINVESEPGKGSRFEMVIPNKTDDK